MPSITRLTFFTVALSLILSLFCLPPSQTTFASRNLHCAHSPDDHSRAYKKGMDALRGNNYEKAAEHFKQAAADKLDDMWAFYYFGLCLLRLKRVDEAANAYRQALAIKPDPAVHYQLGKTYLEMGDREAAEKELRWLQEHDQELALYLSDLFPSDKAAAQQTPSSPVSSAGDKQTIERATKDLKPTITYSEPAKYTGIARINAVQGTVMLVVVFTHNREIQNIRVVRRLPDGLTRKAIEAARTIKFKPATKDGKPVSVQMPLEFTFNNSMRVE
jgi:TonB family protein